ncbi:hypothetical protein D3C87_1804710 [compost metagenome]
MHLVTNPSRVDDAAAVMGNEDFIQLDLPAVAINAEIAHPGRPGGTKPGEFAVEVTGIGETSAIDHLLILVHRITMGGAILPVGLFFQRVDQRNSARIG